MNRSMQSIFAVIAVLIALVSLGLSTKILSVSSSPSAHYRQFQDEKSFNTIFSRVVKPHEKIERVEQLVGVGSRQNGESRDRTLRGIKRIATQTPNEFPDGAQDGDIIVGYETDGITQFIQFRDGRLMNHNPKDFEQPMTIFVLNDQSLAR